jgi:hypothetical protein
MIRHCFPSQSGRDVDLRRTTSSSVRSRKQPLIEVSGLLELVTTDTPHYRNRPVYLELAPAAIEAFGDDFAEGRLVHRGDIGRIDPDPVLGVRPGMKIPFSITKSAPISSVSWNRNSLPAPR